MHKLAFAVWKCASLSFVLIRHWWRIRQGLVRIVIINKKRNTDEQARQTYRVRSAWCHPAAPSFGGDYLDEGAGGMLPGCSSSRPANPGHIIFSMPIGRFLGLFTPACESGVQDRSILPFLLRLLGRWNRTEDRFTTRTP